MRAAISPPPANNLPLANGPIVGRRDEIRLLSALLTDPECQVVTVTGMGGSGKTRLALEVARTFASPLPTLAEQPFADGIAFVQLVDLPLALAEGAGHALLAAWADALDVVCERSPSALRLALTNYLKSREMLVLLDNLENVRNGVVEIEQVLRHAPRVKVLATSRTPLHLEGERVLHVDGLSLPVNAEEIDTAEASALFRQEARRVQVGFALPECQRQYLLKMCHQLGGFPLAMLLAARWAPVLPCSDMVRELAKGLDVLATPEPDLPERHRSIRHILDTTLAQLTTEERALAQELAEVSTESDAQPVGVGVGVRVGVGGGRTPSDILPGLRVLSEQALISVDSTYGRPRLHPLVSRYVRGAKRRRLSRTAVRE
jgi:predicted ATPase